MDRSEFTNSDIANDRIALVQTLRIFEEVLDAECLPLRMPFKPWPGSSMCRVCRVCRV